MPERQCWHNTPNRASTHNLHCRDIPPPGPSNKIDRGGDPGLVAFWLFIAFCVVMLALLIGTFTGVIG